MNIQNSASEQTKLKKKKKKILVKEMTIQLDADPKAIQQIDFTGNWNRTGKTTPLLTVEES